MAIHKSKGEIPPAARHPSPPWTDLPGDLTAKILQRLGTIDLMVAEKVCSTWRSVCQQHPFIWRVIDMAKIGNSFYLPKDCLQSMCLHAIDRSQGQAVDIRIIYFGTDKLLHCISQRCSKLRCLKLVMCSGITSKGITDVIDKFPLLEELHLHFMKSTIHEKVPAIVEELFPKLKVYELSPCLVVEK